MSHTFDAFLSCFAIRVFSFLPVVAQKASSSTFLGQLNRAVCSQSPFSEPRFDAPLRTHLHKRP